MQIGSKPNVVHSTYPATGRDGTGLHYAVNNDGPGIRQGYRAIQFPLTGHQMNSL